MQDEVFCFEEREEGDGYSIYSVQAQYRQMRDAVIPSAYDGRPVVAIDEGAFDSMETLESVEIPDSVTHIGDMAFAWCSRLKRVKLGGAKVIGKETFAWCAALEQITIPATTIEIGTGVLNGCNALKTIEVEAGNPRYHSKGNCLIETKKKALLAGCPFSVIPDDGSVTNIGDEAFAGLETLTEIDIPATIEYLGNRVFDSCNALKKLHIPASVQCIDDGLTVACETLVELTVDKNNSIYHSAGNCIIDTESKSLVAGCGASVIPDDGSVTEIAESAFVGLPLRKAVHIPAAVTEIADGAFCDLSALETITVDRRNERYHSDGNCLIETDRDALILGCNSSEIPDGVRSIESHAFCDCRFEHIRLPRGIRTIEDSAFRNCERLTELAVPEGVTSIGEWAFAGCKSLRKIALPISLVSIGGWVIVGCDRLSEIVYAGSKKQWRAIRKQSDWLPYTRTPIDLFARGLFGKSKKIGVLTDSPFKGLRK
ncbi:MAG: leucine-rich repeat domain-containing protein [Clostridia bacterium]|jgi:hypothetical protein|nr:leucine-rich repeat domain-containing protein [Clostridia bacterium]